VTGAQPHRRVSPRQITQLLAWARRLSTAGPDADPTEVAAYLAAKAELLARITDPTTTSRSSE
jgi:hypothetical protein